MRELIEMFATDNPFGKQHGAPTDDNRHVGDLGNFKTDGQGNGKGSVQDSQIKLIGETSVLGVCSPRLKTLSVMLTWPANGRRPRGHG